jgi:deazaflavin-dependent oxidoreductase (nitroreductase family)
VALELRYTGRRSGQEYAMPVQYARDGDRLVLWPQQPDQSTWWRNFREPRPVTVRLAGAVRIGTAKVLPPDDPQWQQARRRYVARWRSFESKVSGPLVIVTLS